MMDNNEYRSAMRQVEELRKNPPRVTQEHRDGAKKMSLARREFEAKKDRDISSERKALAKECAGFTYKFFHGCLDVFHGVGPGKKNICNLCGEHRSSMFHTNDNNWYCEEHRWFGNLSETQKEKERLCLSTKQTNL